jgi:hypothetical protein
MWLLSWNPERWHWESLAAPDASRHKNLVRRRGVVRVPPCTMHAGRYRWDILDSGRPVQSSPESYETIQGAQAAGQIDTVSITAGLEVSWSPPSLHGSSPSATDESRLSRRCSGHACSYRCAAPWVLLIRQRHRAFGISFFQSPRATGTLFPPGSWLRTAPRCATVPARWSNAWGRRASFLALSRTHLD